MGQPPSEKRISGMTLALNEQALILFKITDYDFGIDFGE